MELPKIGLPKVELPKVPSFDATETRERVAARLAEVQDDVVALPKAGEVVAELRERAEKATADVRRRVTHRVETLRQAAGL